MHDGQREGNDEDRPDRLEPGAGYNLRMVSDTKRDKLGGSRMVPRTRPVYREGNPNQHYAEQTGERAQPHTSRRDRGCKGSRGSGKSRHGFQPLYSLLSNTPNGFETASRP